jgi:hypothetical protein
MSVPVKQLYTDSHAIFSSLQTIYKSHVHLTIVTRQSDTPLKPLSGLFGARSAGSMGTPSTHAFASQPGPTLVQSKFAGSVQDGLRPGPDQIMFYRRIMDEYVARLEDVVKDVRLDVSSSVSRGMQTLTSRLSSTFRHGNMRSSERSSWRVRYMSRLTARGFPSSVKNCWTGITRITIPMEPRPSQDSWRMS